MLDSIFRLTEACDVLLRVETAGEHVRVDTADVLVPFLWTVEEEENRMDEEPRDAVLFRPTPVLMSDRSSSSSEQGLAQQNCGGGTSS